MTSLPTICICTATNRDGLNLVWEVIGRGPNNFSRALCAIDSDVTSSTPTTHYMFQDMSATEDDVIKWQNLRNGILPIIQGVWGENRIISEEDALTACVDNFQIYSAPDSEVNATEFCINSLQKAGLMFIPSEVN